ncbi:hypothetical protein GO986_18880 [Deinococcus sp. HMF7620]|uniref:SAF domain-containing protein n=1 Tax=Deinococcus arboris TaxID=2682977 RepID=A0A7C9I1B9_9DEIO|nr:hypothetical protein [Deinococcus arboris]MVN88808.1 hypothetical protein [Deinococcus arboris]
MPRPDPAAPPPTLLCLAGLTLALALSSCGTPTPGGNPAAVQAQTAMQAQRAAPCDTFTQECPPTGPTEPADPAEPTEVADPTVLHTPASAAETFAAQGGVASVPVTGEVPGWARDLMDGDHLRAGSVKLGEPVEVRSTVELSVSGEDAAADAQAGAAALRTLAEVGDAALLPLLLPSGDLAGWVRLPLVPVAPDAASPRHEAVDIRRVARPRLALLTTPAKSPSAAAARQAAGAGPEAQVLALATGGSDYRPFDFTWLVQTGGQPTLVTQGQPNLVTDDGRLMPSLEAGARPAEALKPVEPSAALKTEASFAPYHPGQQEEK